MEEVEIEDDKGFETAVQKISDAAMAAESDGAQRADTVLAMVALVTEVIVKGSDTYDEAMKGKHMVMMTMQERIDDEYGSDNK